MLRFIGKIQRIRVSNKDITIILQSRSGTKHFFNILGNFLENHRGFLNFWQQNNVYTVIYSINYRAKWIYLITSLRSYYNCYNTTIRHNRIFNMNHLKTSLLDCQLTAQTYSSQKLTFILLHIYTVSIISNLSAVSFYDVYKLFSLF